MTDAQVRRRAFLAGVAGAAFVVGFDPLSRTWVRTASADEDCSDFPAHAHVPALDGTLTFDPSARAADSIDLGNIASAMPVAILRPASTEDVAKMVRFCRTHGIQVAARGQHHSMFGQGLTCGLIVETRTLSTIHSVGPEGADVDAGVLWKELLYAAFAEGLRPRGLTGFTGLSIGGTLSVGGSPLNNNEGALVDHVQALTVVTGRGDVVECSECEHRDLFEAALAGLGQCGIITRAKVDLVPALPLARSYLLDYQDAASFFQDFRTLALRGEIDEVYSVSAGAAFSYQINATVFFDPSSPPDDAFLLRDLTIAPSAVPHADQPYTDYATFVDQQIAVLRAYFDWDNLIKPWFDVWLPDSAVDDYVGDVAANLTPQDIGPVGFVLLFAHRRSSFRRPFLRVPDGDPDDLIWLFDIATASAGPGPNPAFVDQMLKRNRALFERARDVGGTRYPIGATPFDREDWETQYGGLWPLFRRLKRRYDPENILTPGPAIF